MIASGIDWSILTRFQLYPYPATFNTGSFFAYFMLEVKNFNAQNQA
ncbi:hypothetical protein BH10CHL1_BH10CHL1_36170 [soil metagenome]